jgi:hypothetical protein
MGTVIVLFFSFNANSAEFLAKFNDILLIDMVIRHKHREQVCRKQ